MLLLSGDDDDQLLSAATSLALMTVSAQNTNHPTPLLGNSVRIGAFPLPPARVLNDAPRWLSTERQLPLSMLESGSALVSDGSRPLPTYFRMPPDLDYGENQNLNLKLGYRYNSTPLATHSAMRIFANGKLVNDVILKPGFGVVDKHRVVIVPIADLRPFGNTMLVNFDFVPRDATQSSAADDAQLRGAVLQSTYLDLRGLAHRTTMPNLELFANAGFPFTRSADLSHTVVILPTNPTVKELALLLTLMSHCGTQTGYPVLRVGVSGPEALMRSDQDYLILGNLADQPLLQSLQQFLPVLVDSSGFHAQREDTLYTRWKAYAQQQLGRLGPRFQSQPQFADSDGNGDALIEGIQSPFFPGRSIVLIALRNDDVVDEFVDAFVERSQSSDIGQSVSVLNSARFKSYPGSQSGYDVGTLGPYRALRLWLANHFWFLFLLVNFVCLILARYARDYLDMKAAIRLEV